MDINLAKTLVGIIDDSELREEYSGRGMYGKTTAGVVIDNLADVITAIIENADCFVDLYGSCLYDPCGLKIDNMGKRYILY